MKNIAVIALFITASFISAGSASAQDHCLYAKIPFSFAVGDRTLPAGTYTLSSAMHSPTLVALRDRQHGIEIMTFGQPNENNPKRTNALVFHQIGNQYYLREVRSSDSSINIQFPTTRAEKQARAQVAEAGLFVNDPVLIALK